MCASSSSTTIATIIASSDALKHNIYPLAPHELYSRLLWLHAHHFFSACWIKIVVCFMAFVDNFRDLFVILFMVQKILKIVINKNQNSNGLKGKRMGLMSTLSS